MMLFPDNWFSKICPLIDDQGFTIVGSISQMHRIPASQDPKKLILYNWDVYPWLDYSSGPWKRWGELMRDCADVWHASEACKRRTEEIFGISKGIVIKTFVPIDWLNDDLGDDRYVLMPMRFYEKDKCFGWAEKACEELDIPLVHPNHNIPFEKYRKTLQHCTLILSHYAEASTGGLGMIEGRFCGKPVLANGSFFNGAREYMGDQAVYFNDFDDLKATLKFMWESQKKTILEENRQWVRENYDISIMAKKINERLCQLKSI